MDTGQIGGWFGFLRRIFAGGVGDVIIIRAKWSNISLFATCIPAFWPNTSPNDINSRPDDANSRANDINRRKKTAQHPAG